MLITAIIGFWGAVNYAYGGFVDLRLVFLLYLGSLTGIHIGVYGTRVVKEKVIRLVTGIIILLCVFSRGINIPVYLNKLHYLELSADASDVLSILSKILLFASGIAGVLVILTTVGRSHSRRRKAQRVIDQINT